MAKMAMKYNTTENCWETFAALTRLWNDGSRLMCVHNGGWLLAIIAQRQPVCERLTIQLLLFIYLFFCHEINYSLIGWFSVMSPRGGCLYIFPPTKKINSPLLIYNYIWHAARPGQSQSVKPLVSTTDWLTVTNRRGFSQWFLCLQYFFNTFAINFK